MHDMMKQMKKMMRDMERSLFLEPEHDIFQIFTEKRMEMLKEIRESRPTSIRELAGNLDRDIKNVYDDLNILFKHKIISFEVLGRRKRPLIKKDLIVIELG
jgi:predicted transcriptional regulator